ncbi:MAG: TonB-dependent receptor plug domain-containing protein [Bacteroidetes bacterium]|nr:TonB-dependent receptor plug domain-containing protein [Bacteroidota bacterium]
MKNFVRNLIFLSAFCFGIPSFSQTVIKGSVVDASSGEPLIGASIFSLETSEGTITEFDGSFELKIKGELPIQLTFSYTGYEEQVIEVTSVSNKLNVRLAESAIITTTVEVVGQRISDKQKASPLTVESLDLLGIKQTPSDNFYDGLGSLKGVDLTAASLGFKVINMRGFNSTSPVRSLQIIDGVDNQAPGLNFSLGNFLGSSELDVLKVDLIQGASSAYYGPSAFNGVISMETKNPFLHKGLSAIVKGGERNLLETAFRWADSFKNKEGYDWMAYKLNFSYLRADDWVANNDDAVDGTKTPKGNPGGWDRINTYGDEYFSLSDFSNDTINLPSNRAGLGIFHRTGYQEKDLVDYGTKNLKSNLAFHFRLNPSKSFESTELILSSSFGTGTTVYQGDNRFSLRDILFFQNRIEVKKADKFFVRAYATHENAGNSYDPYFTALRLQELAKSQEDWSKDYTGFWKSKIYPKMKALDYPVPTVSPMGQLVFDYDAAYDWLNTYADSIYAWHQLAAAKANTANVLINTTQDFFEPGTDRFQTAFDSITSLKNTEGGTRFFDESALYHFHGEYVFTPSFIDEIKVGANGRIYRPFSDGTVFKDSANIRITNKEVGFYTGLKKKFSRQWTVSATLRADKNENFDLLFTPAASLVWSPDLFNYLRISFSSGVRNPTLTDQYLNLNVGRATLLGNLEGFDSLVTVESFLDYLGSGFSKPVVYFNAPAVKPEKVKTFEVGYRTTLFEKLYIDAGYYYNIYNDFIGYVIGVDTDFDPLGPPLNTKVYRVASNSTNEVTTQGMSIGANFYFAKFYQISGNYSWNKLNKSFPDDPIIPAFNTPEHKYNIGLSGRDLPVTIGPIRTKNLGFNINYKWIQGFVFEGSPQFTGGINDYALLDAQVNVRVPKINTTFKIGASNLLNNKAFQTYGGPSIGRLAYISLLYEWKKD